MDYDQYLQSRRESYIRRKQKASELGLCVLCMSPRDREGKSTCSKCYSKRSEYDRRIYESRAAKRLCVICGTARARPGKRTCDWCGAKKSETVKAFQRRKKGECSQ